MFDPTKPVKTRDGRRARILSFFDEIKLRYGDRIVGLVESDDQGSCWEVRSWQADGAYARGKVCREDLVNVPETVTRRVYLYRFPDGSEQVTSIPAHVFDEAPSASVDVTFKIGKFAGADK